MNRSKLHDFRLSTSHMLNVEDSVWLLPLYHTRAVLWQGGPRDATVNFDT